MDPARTARITHAGTRRPRAAAAWGRLHARLYRLSRGRFLPHWFGAPVMVLETVGRRSGRQRATPVLHLERGDAQIVCAANAGSDEPPAWWLNLRDAGSGTVVLGDDRRPVRPRLLQGAERDEAWREFVRMYPAAEEYTRFTERVLPLIALEPLQPPE